MQVSGYAERDDRAAEIIRALLSDRGWNPIDVERASKRKGSGHPMRFASYRTVYRVLKDSRIPQRPQQFEIAAAFGLLPSHVWGGVPLPAPWEHINELTAVMV